MGGRFKGLVKFMENSCTLTATKGKRQGNPLWHPNPRAAQGGGVQMERPDSGQAHVLSPYIASPAATVGHNTGRD